MAGQVVSDPHQHASQPAVGVADERSAIVVGLIALIIDKTFLIAKPM
jgi:hypothetical protein